MITFLHKKKDKLYSLYIRSGHINVTAYCEPRWFSSVCILQACFRTLPKKTGTWAAFQCPAGKPRTLAFFPFWTSAEKEQSTLIKILQARKARCHLSTHALRVRTCLFCYEEGETSLSVLLFAKLYFLTFSLALLITRDVKLIQTTADRLRGGKQLDTRRYLHFKVSVDSEQSGMAGFWRGVGGTNVDTYETRA